MNVPARRPTAVFVIGCGAIGVGILGLASGVVTSFDPERIFPHQTLIGLIEVTLAVFLIGAGRALLHLRTWGAVVIQVFAVLSLLFVVAFGSLFAWLTFRMGGPQGARPIIIGVGVAVFYAVPLLLVARSVAAIRRRGLLR